MARCAGSGGQPVEIAGSHLQSRRDRAGRRAGADPRVATPGENSAMAASKLQSLGGSSQAHAGIGAAQPTGLAVKLWPVIQGDRSGVVADQKP